jgi:hypothetical protein
MGNLGNLDLEAPYAMELHRRRAKCLEGAGLLEAARDRQVDVEDIQLSRDQRLHAQVAVSSNGRRNLSEGRGGDARKIAIGAWANAKVTSPADHVDPCHSSQGQMSCSIMILQRR